MKINEFTGGLNSKIDPSLLKGNTAVTLINADIQSGVMRAIYGDGTATYSSVSPYFVIYDGDIVSQSTLTNYVEYVQDLYYTNSSGTLLKNYLGVINDVGLPQPPTKLGLSSYDQPAKPADFGIIYISYGTPVTSTGITYSGTGTFPSGSPIHYILVFRSVATGLLISSEFTPRWGLTSSTVSSITITGITVPSGQETELYRHYAGGFRSVGTLAFGAGTSITDSAYDLSAVALETHIMPAPIPVIHVMEYSLTGGNLDPLTSYDYKLQYTNEGSDTYNTVSFSEIPGAGIVKQTINAGAPEGHTVTLFRDYLGTFRQVGSTLVNTSLFASLVDDTLDVSVNAAYSSDTITNSFLQANTPHGFRIRTFQNSLESDPIELSYTSSLYNFFVLFPVDNQGYYLSIDDTTLVKEWLTVPASDTIYLGDSGDLSYAAFTDSNHVNGTYQYVYTYYNSTTAAESKPSPVSDEIAVLKGSVDVSGFYQPPGLDSSDYDYFRIYRVGGALTSFSQIGTAPNGSFYTITPFYDTLSDTEIVGTNLITETYNVAPVNLTLLVEINGVLIGAVGSKMHYSIQGIVHAWPATNFIEFGTDITCIEESANGIIVCTSTKTFVVTGNTPANYSKYLISGEHGCVFTRSFQRLGGGVIFKSSTHLCYTSGGKLEVLTSANFNPLDITIIESCVHNNTYYALSTSDIFIFDITNKNFYTIAIVATGIAVIDDSVQVLITGSLYKLGSDTSTQRTITYLSPMFTDEGHSVHKVYKNFYFALNGTFTLTIYLDGVLVVTKAVTGRAIHEVKVPQSLQRAMDMQIGISGVGTVYGYDWTTLGRQNGR